MVLKCEDYFRIAYNPPYSGAIESPNFCRTAGCLNKAVIGSNYCLPCLERGLIWKMFPDALIDCWDDGWVIKYHGITFKLKFISEEG